MSFSFECIKAFGFSPIKAGNIFKSFFCCAKISMNLIAEIAAKLFIRREFCLYSWLEGFMDNAHIHVKS